MSQMTYSLGESFEYFRLQSNLSPGTLDTYGFAVQHFYTFLESSGNAEPLSIAGPDAPDRPLELLGSQPQDMNLLAWFIIYLGREVEPVHVSAVKQTSKENQLGPVTARIHGQAVITWFAFLADELLLPDRFSAKAAIARAQRRLRTYVPRSRAREAAPEPPEGIEELIHAFDSPCIPDSLPLKRGAAENLRLCATERCSTLWRTAGHASARCYA